MTHLKHRHPQNPKAIYTYIHIVGFRVKKRTPLKMSFQLCCNMLAEYKIKSFVVSLLQMQLHKELGGFSLLIPCDLQRELHRLELPGKKKQLPSLEGKRFKVSLMGQSNQITTKKQRLA